MDWSAFFVVVGSLGSAWIAARFNLREKRLAADRESRADYEKYKNERLAERDRAILNPLRVEIMFLEGFIESVELYTAHHETSLFTDDEREESARKVRINAIRLFKYPEIRAAWDEFEVERFRYESTSRFDEKVMPKVNQLSSLTEALLRLKYADLNELLRDMYEPGGDNSKSQEPIRPEGGLLVKISFWIENRVRKLME